jgi:hypothetical protein
VKLPALSNVQTDLFANQFLVCRIRQRCRWVVESPRSSKY